MNKAVELFTPSEKLTRDAYLVGAGVLIGGTCVFVGNLAALGLAAVWAGYAAYSRQQTEQSLKKETMRRSAQELTQDNRKRTLLLLHMKQVKAVARSYKKAPPDGPIYEKSLGETPCSLRQYGLHSSLVVTESFWRGASPLGRQGEIQHWWLLRETARFLRRDAMPSKMLRVGYEFSSLALMANFLCLDGWDARGVGLASYILPGLLTRQVKDAGNKVAAAFMLEGAFGLAVTAYGQSTSNYELPVAWVAGKVAANALYYFQKKYHSTCEYGADRVATEWMGNSKYASWALEDLAKMQKEVPPEKRGTGDRVTDNAISLTQGDWGRNHNNLAMRLSKILVRETAQKAKQG